MNTVVLYIDDCGYLGRTFECCNEYEQRLAVNLICKDISVNLLTESEFIDFLDCGEFITSRDCGLCNNPLESGRIVIGGLEAIS